MNLRRIAGHDPWSCRKAHFRQPGPGISQRGKITRDSGVDWSSLDINPPGSSRGQATSCKLQRILDKPEAASLTVTV